METEIQIGRNYKTKKISFRKTHCVGSITERKWQKEEWVKLKINRNYPTWRMEKKIEKIYKAYGICGTISKGII